MPGGFGAPLFDFRCLVQDSLWCFIVGPASLEGALARLRSSGVQPACCPFWVMMHCIVFLGLQHPLLLLVAIIGKSLKFSIEEAETFIIVPLT